MIRGAHKKYLDSASEFFKKDSRFIGLLGGGSLIDNNLDKYSDLDLIAVSKDDDNEIPRSELLKIIDSLGNIVSAFTAEHIGEPRLYICLYKDPVLHVDIKFISLNELKKRIENPIVLYEEEKIITNFLKTTESEPIKVDLQWIEDRFWVWIHYVCTKLGRGELFETISFLDYLRGTVFGPMAMELNNKDVRGVRRLEAYSPEFIDELKKTIAQYDVNSCKLAIEESIKIYRKLRKEFKSSSEHRKEAEKMAVNFFNDVFKGNIEIEECV